MEPNDITTGIITLLGGGALGSIFTFLLHRKKIVVHASIEQSKVDADNRIKENKAETDRIIELANNTFALSQRLQDAMEKDMETMRKLLRDTQTMCDTIATENRKLITENERLMVANERLERLNEQLKADCARLTLDKDSLHKEVSQLTGRIEGLEKVLGGNNGQ